MGSKTGISWTEATWNMVVGCSKVSPGCANCYAETLALRFGWSTLPWVEANAQANVILKPERLDLPLRWQEPRRIFVNSLSDLHHELIPDVFIDQVYAVMALAPRHIYQVLTKRPERMQAYLKAPGRSEAIRDAMEPFLSARRKLRAPAVLVWPLPQVWQGVTIENDRWVGRADVLRATPAAVRFISAEPLLSALPSLDLSGIDQVIVGGESGAGARPMALSWARDIATKAATAGTAFFFKQTGLVLAQELGLAGKGDRSGEWPIDLQVQREPAAAAHWSASNEASRV